MPDDPFFHSRSGSKVAVAKMSTAPQSASSPGGDDGGIERKLDSVEHQLQQSLPPLPVPDDPFLHSCNASKVDLTKMSAAAAAAAAAVDDGKEARLDVVEQKHDDAQSLRRRQSSDHTEASAISEEPSVCTIFNQTAGGNETDQQSAIEEGNDPFDNISIQQQQTTEAASPAEAKLPRRALDIKIEAATVTSPLSTAPSSSYGTPVAPTPSTELAPHVTGFATSTPDNQRGPGTGGQLGSVPRPPAPITSPLPNSAPMANPTLDAQLSSSSADELLGADEFVTPENPQVS